MEELSIDNIQDLLIQVQGTAVLVDADVARLYAVQTRDINKAVKNNPEKFPSGYVVQLKKEQKKELVENFHRFENLKHSSVILKPSQKKACTCWQLSSKVPKQLKRPCLLLKLLPKFAS